MGFGLLVWCLYIVSADLAWEVGRSKILHSIGEPGSWGTVLAWQIGGFLFALLVLHLLLAAIAWVLAIAGEPATPVTVTERRVRVGIWFGLLTLWVLVANQTHFPASEFSSAGWAWVAERRFLGLSPFVAFTISLSVAVALSLIAAARRLAPILHRSALARGTALIFAGLLVIATVSGAGGAPDRISAAVDQSRPNVIVIGIDSLRCDTAVLAEEGSLTPNVDRFVAEAHSFSDVTTPLARTFGAWVSILTGQHPVTTNARFNLMPRELVDAEAALGWTLKRAGYRSLYATDEVRFANIDQSYGFDELIAPTMGASDFLLAKINDLPLTNLLASTRMAETLFPNTYTNRAAYATYQPREFVNRIGRALPDEQPLFLVAHLTLAHYPYSWAGHAKPEDHPAYRTGYKAALREVDQQFADLLGVLKGRGVLDNAVVVLLSDHGEALGFQNDSLLRGFDDPDMLWASLWGHGTSVLSPHQFQVVLAFRGFGPASLPTHSGVHDFPATLEDVSPTLLDLLRLEREYATDGLSLAGLMRGERGFDSLSDRIRFTETGFNTPRVLKGQYDERGLLKEGAIYYDLVPETGWLQLKPDRLGALLEQKERAAMSRQLLLAALPPGENRSRQYILAPRGGGLAMRLDAPPDPAVHPEAARLWQALHERFAGEI